MSVQPPDLLLGVATAERLCQGLQEGMAGTGTSGDNRSPELSGKEG